MLSKGNIIISVYDNYLLYDNLVIREREREREREGEREREVISAKTECIRIPKQFTSI